MATYCWPQRTLTGLAGGWGATALAASLRITTGAKLMDYSGRVAGRQVMSFVEMTLADGRGRCVIVHYTKRLDGMSRHDVP